MVKTILALVMVTGLMGCTTHMDYAMNGPYGTTIYGYSIRDGFTNDCGTVVFDKDGKISGALPGSCTNAAAVWASAANAAVISGGYAAIAATTIK